MINGRRMTEEEKRKLFSKYRSKKPSEDLDEDPGGRVRMMMHRRREKEKGLPPMQSTSQADPVRASRVAQGHKPNYSKINALVDRGVIPGKAPEPSIENIRRGAKAEFTRVANKIMNGTLSKGEELSFIKRHGETGARLIARVTNIRYNKKHKEGTLPVDIRPK